MQSGKGEKGSKGNPKGTGACSGKVSDAAPGVTAGARFAGFPGRPAQGFGAVDTDEFLELAGARRVAVPSATGVLVRIVVAIAVLGGVVVVGLAVVRSVAGGAP